MAFNHNPVSTNNNRKSYYVSKTNTSFRISLQDKYDIYESRIRTLANFFNWSDKKLNASLSMPNWDNEKVDLRLKELEKEMEQAILRSQQTLEEKRKSSPNSIIFQIIDANNVSNTYSINEEHPSASKLLDGLIFRTSKIEESPFKSKENVKNILDNYEKMKEEAIKEDKKTVKKMKI